MDDISKISTQELQQQYDMMKHSLSERNARLQDRRKRHEKIDFANPLFNEKYEAIEAELKKRNVI